MFAATRLFRAVVRLILAVHVVAGPCDLSAQPRWERVLPTADVTLRDPRSLSVSVEGLLYIADTGHQRVIAVDSAGRLVAETGGIGAAHGQFRWPTVVIADRGNAVWVLDRGNRRIEKFTRSLEYQGTVTIPSSGDEGRGQPDAVGASPQGDLYVFDRDGGRIIHFDPLFRTQAELGSGTGSQFVSNVTSMAFVAKVGLFWWERGSSEIRRTDLLLNPLPPLRLPNLPRELVLASADTCLIYGSLGGVMSRCGHSTVPDTLLSGNYLRECGLKSVQSISLAPDQWLYLLDNRQGAVFRAHVTRE
ncbi:NHL repeat-containing protein [bacterium]|nr:NHL repeat-containing protein [bacterium]MBU1984697.1 NHL repeat-containing protein [bacterium]